MWQHNDSQAALQKLDGLTHHSLGLVRDCDPVLDVAGVVCARSLPLPWSVQLAFYGQEAALRLAGPRNREGVRWLRDRRVLATTPFGELA